MKVLWTLFLLLTLVPAAWGDSPITSTDFWQAYKDLPQVASARKLRRLDEGLSLYLVSQAPLDEKAAVINALSWDYKGPRHSGLFRSFLATRLSCSEDQVEGRLGGADAMCLGYLTALDNLEAAEFALPLLRRARHDLPKSFTVALLATLAEAQTVRIHWEKIWPLTERLLAQPGLRNDLRPEARARVLDYLRYYQEYAPKKKDVLLN